jgi:transposase
MARPTRYSPEVRERAVRLVREHGPEHPSQWAAIAAIAPKLGCTSETLRRWVRQAERDTGHRAGLTTDERQRLKELEREASADTSKPAIDRHVKTGHHERGDRDTGVLLRGRLRTQVGLDLGAPAARSTLEDVRMMEEPVE